MSKKVITFISLVLILGGALTLFLVSYRNGDKDDVPLVFADRTMLSSLWDNYKKVIWESETGRTVDKERDSITTSEGQSYTMLRAVWQSDKETFDKSWSWTQEQLGRPDDELFSWKWGQRVDKTYGVLTADGGFNTASDGDVDIALALLMAGERWQQKSYIDQAKAIINDIWEKEVVEINGFPYLAGNNLEKQAKDSAIINPSYFAPYAFKIFARADKNPKHNWEALVDSSYALINTSIDSKLGSNASAGLVPDWIVMSKADGSISKSNDASLSTNYGFDAMRTPFRLALDYKWNKDERAKQTLKKMNLLSTEWKNKEKIGSVYAHDGTVISGDEVSAIYGGNIGYFDVVEPETAKEIFDLKLKKLYDPSKQSWASEMSYYSDSWAWFGIALHTDALDNIAKDL